MKDKILVATKEELKQDKIRCWGKDCKRRAWLDYMGWHYCLKHWWQDYRWGGKQSIKSLLLHIKYTKIKL